jgi:hypothetical protein
MKPRKVEGSAFDVLKDRRISVLMGGIQRELTVEEALFYRTYQDALNGKVRAVRAVLEKINEREARLAPNGPRLPIIRFEERNPLDVDDALVTLGIATPTGGSTFGGRPFLELESWAVAAALKRPKGPRLDDRELKDLKSRTRDAGAVDWAADRGE